MAKLPKALIKKYGISKKAWSIFKAQKGKTRKRVSSSKPKRRFYTMARKRKKTYRRGAKTSFMKKAGEILLGAAGAVVYDVFISPMIPLASNLKNWLELAVGIFLAVSPRIPKVLRYTGAAMAIINAYSIISPLVAGTASNGGGLSGYLSS